MSVDGDRRCEHETLHRTRVDGGVDKVDAADEVVLVVEVLDEVAQSLGRIGRQVEYIGKLLAREKIIHELDILHGSLHEFCACRHVFRKTARQVIQHDHAIARFDEPFSHVRSDKSGTAGHKYILHFIFL